MSSHRRRVKHFGRKFKARKALFRGLVSSLVEHGRISTTVDKAKELRRYVEKAITLGKKGDLATRRLLLSRYPNENTVERIIGDLSKRFVARPGGYTRIIKTGTRPGDSAEMAFLEFVDYDYTKKVEDVKATKESKEKTGGTAKVKKSLAKRSGAGKSLVGRKKSLARKQKKDRALARG